jgi:asparagine synthase (glutamine-hydrolysing)
MTYSALQIRDTGLQEVTEVQAGERIAFRADGLQRELLWSPVRIAEQDPIQSPEEAVAAVRHQVRACVDAWASVHRAVIHNLSGGLDSSIVLACLKSAPTQPSVTCLHFYAPATQEDERHFARLAAGHMNAELVECEIDPTQVKLERILQIRRGAKPWFYVYDLDHSHVEARLAAEKGATGIFSGSGGDAVFLQARADLAVTDYVHRNGLRPALLPVALHAARITRTSMWPLLWRGVVRRFTRSAPRTLAESTDIRTLIPAAVLEAARNDDSLIHPWLREAGPLPPGLAWHVLCMSVPPAFYESFGGATDVERTLVLMSQPIIELCLHIPSYVWITGGMDRAIARRAFAADLPRETLRRRAKGAINRHNRKVLDENAGFVRAMLMDGLLVRQGLLDRTQLDLQLSQRGAPSSFEYNEILNQHLSTEVWLRRWSELGQRSESAAWQAL